MQKVVDGILTNCLEFGDLSKPNILILPGWGNDITSWLPTASALERDHHVILLDLPGFGKTNKPNKTFDIYDYANFVKSFLQKMNISEVILIGHSFGGRISLILASEGNLVQRLVLVDSAGIGDFSASYRKVISIYKALRGFLPKKVQMYLRSKLGSTDYLHAGEMRDIFVKVISQDLTHHLASIVCPTLIIWGDKDAVLDIKLAKVFKENINDSKIRVVWGARHNPHLEKPEEFLGILLEELNAE